MHRITCSLLIFLGLFLAIPSSTEAKTISQVLADAKVLYLTGEYEKALNELARLKPYVNVMKPEDKIELYKYLGFCHTAFGKLDEAKTDFQEALKINPNLALDPSTVSPKIIEVFEGAKAAMPAQPATPPVQEAKPAPPPPVQEAKPAPAPAPAPPVAPAKPGPAARPHPRPPVVRPTPPVTAKVTPSGAALRSLALPGWGQIVSGQKTKGYIIMGAAAGALGFLGYTHAAYFQAQSSYKSASDPVTAMKAYDDYNKANSMKNISYIVIGVVWAGNVLEAFLSAPAPPTPAHASVPLEIIPVSGGAQLAYRYEF